MPLGLSICEIRATTRRLTGLKISTVLVSGRVITTCPWATATWLKPGSPGRSIMATCFSRASVTANAEQLKHTIIKTKDNNLGFRMKGYANQSSGMRAGADLMPGEYLVLSN